MKKYSPRLKERYVNEIVPKLKDSLGYSNVMQVPKLNKICIYCKENFDNEIDFNEITHSELIEFLQNHEPYEFARNSGEVDLLYEFLYDYDGDENDELNSILEEKWLG